MVEMCQNVGRVGLGWEGCGNLAGIDPGKSNCTRHSTEPQKTAGIRTTVLLPAMGPVPWCKKLFPESMPARFSQVNRPPANHPPDTTMAILLY